MAALMDCTRKELQETTIKLSECQTRLLRSQQEKEHLVATVQASKRSLEEKSAWTLQLEDQLQTQQATAEEKRKLLANVSKELQATKEELELKRKTLEDQQRKLSRVSESLETKATVS